MIYFIECIGRVKIGFSLDPYNRLNKVAADAPFPCAIIGVVSGDRSMEADIQARWKHLHCHREWFAASKELLDWVAKNTSVRPTKKGRMRKSGDERKPHGEMCGFTVKRGTKGQIARECGLTPPAIAQWKKVPAEYCEIVSRITGLDLQILRPDIFTDAATGRLQ